MARMGYAAEYYVKKKMQEQYGEQNVIKIAIAQQGGDFIICDNGRIRKVIEVKSTKDRVYYPSMKHRYQFHRILNFCQEHGCDFELWVKTSEKEWKIISFDTDFFDYPECRRFVDEVSFISYKEVRVRDYGETAVKHKA